MIDYEAGGIVLVDFPQDRRSIKGIMGALGKDRMLGEDRYFRPSRTAFRL